MLESLASAARLQSCQRSARPLLWWLLCHSSGSSGRGPCTAAARSAPRNSYLDCCQDDCCSTPSSSIALHCTDHDSAVGAHGVSPLRPASSTAQMDYRGRRSPRRAHRDGAAATSARCHDRQLKDSRRQPRTLARLEDADKRRRHVPPAVVGLEPFRRARRCPQKVRGKNMWEGLLPAR